jgi:uncharacterized protein (DUF302 family)
MLKKILLSLVALTFTAGVQAASERHRPFILASTGNGTVAETVESVKNKLSNGGFEVVGSYSPYQDATVIIVTNDAMKNNAAQSDFGGYGAAERVSVTKLGDQVQVAYVNPVYMANGYRMKGDLSDVAAQLEKALGKEKDFGSKKGVRGKKLRKYHYMFGMEYFDDLDAHLLAEKKSHAEAVKTVEDNLKQHVGGASQVYRVDVPGKDEVVFGVALKKTPDGDKYMDDKYIMGHIDFQDPRSTAHLPYEILVSGNKVYSLYARFRIAISFPDLSMMGDNSFMKIMESPEAIKKALTMVAGGKAKKDYWQ